MNINEEYLKFYMKKTPCLHLRYKLVNDSWIDYVFKKFVDVTSSLNKNSLCIFNPFSLTNVMRDNESDKAYVDESEKVTASFNALVEILFRLHSSYSKGCAPIEANIKSSRQVFAAEYPNDDNSVYGLVGFSFVFDTSSKPAEYYAKILSKRANLLNYNVVDFNIESENQKVSFNGKQYTLSQFDIQFEATYQDKVDLKLGRYVYHVTTKNNATKILKQGLLPKNTNSYGFRYPDRVYVFVDSHYASNLAVPYASNSKKRNAKFIRDVNVDSLVKSYEILMKKLDGTVVDSREFAILKIDLEKIGNVKLYRDNTFEVGGDFVAAYTKQAIPPFAIRIEKEFTIPNRG